MRKIDRVLGNDLWEEAFLTASIVFHLEGLFDNSPMVVSFTAFSGGKKSFRFFNYWATKDDFIAKVREVWSIPIEGYHGFQISQKLNILKRFLREWFGQDKHQRDIRHATLSLQSV